METLFYIFLALGIVGIYVVSVANRRRAEIEESVAWALDTIRPLTSELVDGTYLWCDLQSSQFVAQGKTMDDLSQALRLLNTKKVYMLGDHVFVYPDYAPVLVEGSGEIATIYK